MQFKLFLIQVFIFILLVIPLGLSAKQRNKLSEIWGKISKEGKVEKCNLTEYDVSLKTLRVESLRKMFRNVVETKNRNIFKKYGNSTIDTSYIGDLFDYVHEGNDRCSSPESTREKIIIFPKGFYATQNSRLLKVHMQIDLPTHFQANDLHSSLFRMKPNGVLEETLLDHCMISSVECDSDENHSETFKPAAVMQDGWLEVEFTWALKDWLELRQLCHNITLICGDPEGASQCPNLIDKSHKPFLVVMLDTASRMNRDKRETLCDENATVCCRENLKVDFSELQLTSIIKPSGYNAYYCKGNCPTAAAVTQSFYYSAIRKIPNVTLNLCCYPTKYSSIQVLHRVGETIKSSVIPQAVVDACGCS